jgi:hypothetical protein
METSEVLNSPPAPLVTGDATENRMLETQSAAPSAEASSAEVLITEQQVKFSTAAAAASRPGNRLVASLGWVFATAAGDSHSRRQQSVQRRTYYIERARMGREMDRL